MGGYGWILNSDEAPPSSSQSQPDVGSRAGRTRGLPAVLLIEDSPADALLIRETLTEHRVECNLLILKDGEAAVRYFDEMESAVSVCPDLVILDLNLPKKSGYEVLQRIRSSRRCGSIPVVVLSSSNAPADKARALALGSTRYITKPTMLEDFIRIGTTFQELLGLLP